MPFLIAVQLFYRRRGIVPGTNSNEHPRLNSFELRSQLNITKTNSLCQPNLYAVILLNLLVLLVFVNLNVKTINSQIISNISNTNSLYLVTINNNFGSNTMKRRGVMLQWSSS